MSTHDWQSTTTPYHSVDQLEHICVYIHTHNRHIDTGYIHLHLSYFSIFAYLLKTTISHQHHQFQKEVNSNFFFPSVFELPSVTMRKLASSILNILFIWSTSLYVITLLSPLPPFFCINILLTLLGLSCWTLPYVKSCFTFLGYDTFCLTVFMEECLPYPAQTWVPQTRILFFREFPFFPTPETCADIYLNQLY